MGRKARKNHFGGFGCRRVHPSIPAGEAQRDLL